MLFYVLQIQAPAGWAGDSEGAQFLRREGRSLSRREQGVLYADGSGSQAQHGVHAGLGECF